MRSTDRTPRKAPRRNRVGSFASALIAVLVLASCGVPNWAAAGDDSEANQPEKPYGTQATWDVADPAAVKPADRAVHLQVQRVDCASGKTGKIVGADVDYQDEQIAIAVHLEPIVGDQSCQGNEQVPYTVELDEPIGQRELVDAACAARPASGTVMCDDAVRWSPGSADDSTPPRVTG